MARKVVRWSSVLYGGKFPRVILKGGVELSFTSWAELVQLCNMLMGPAIGAGACDAVGNMKKKRRKR